MKNNLGIFRGLSRLGVGAAVLAFCALVPVSRAEVVIDNLNYTSDGQIAFGTKPLAQSFTTSATSGNLSGLTVTLFFSLAGSANIELYNTLSGAPTGSGLLLGTASSLSTGSQNITLSLLNNPLLSANTTYAIVLDTPTSGVMGIGVENQSTDFTDSGGTGTLGGIYYKGASWVEDQGDDYYDYWRMNLSITPIPEVPNFGLILGFGTLAVAVDHSLRRKLRAAHSRVV